MNRLTVAALAVSTLVGAFSGTARAEQMELGARLKGTKLAKRQLDFLAQNPGAAEKLLGEGMRVVPRGTKQLAVHDYWDTEDLALAKSGSILRVRHGDAPLKLNFKIGSGAKVIQREEPGIVLSGDKLGAGHVFGGSGLSASLKAQLAELAKAPAPKPLVKVTSGGQRTTYAIEQNGQHVGVIDLENHFLRDGKGAKGSAQLEYFGDLKTGSKLGQHLTSADQKVRGKRAVVPVKSLGRR